MSSKFSDYRNPSIEIPEANPDILLGNDISCEISRYIFSPRILLRFNYRFSYEYNSNWAAVFTQCPVQCRLRLPVPGNARRRGKAASACQYTICKLMSHINIFIGSIRPLILVCASYSPSHTEMARKLSAER